MKLYFIPPLILQKIIWVPTRLLLIIFGRVEIRGLENLKNLKSPVIFASNHSNEIDSFMVPACLPFWSKFSPIFYMIREQSFYEKIGWKKYLLRGLFIKSWGAYGVKVGLKDYEKSLENHIEIIKSGGNVFVFPEGKITIDGKLQAGKGGSAFLSDKTDVPIVPIFISNVYNMTVLDFFTRKRKIKISFGKAILQDELRKNYEKELQEGHLYKKEMEYVMKRIGELEIK